MGIITKIRHKGIKRIIKTIYSYKIDLLFQRVINTFTKNKKLIDGIIIESHNDFDCNGGPFYDYLIKNNYNKKYKIVWLIKNKLPKKLPENVKAYRLHSPSFMKDYYICRLRFFTADNEIFNKVRADQISFYFTHGAITLKNVNGFMNIPDTTDYVLTPSEFYSPILSRQINIEYPNNKMIDLGYPCHDVFFQETEDEILKITKNKYSKVILWMPTFRKLANSDRSDSDNEYPLGIPLINDKETLLRIQKYFEDNNSLLIIKIHPMQDPSTYRALYELCDLRNIVVLDGKKVKQLGIDNYRLLKSVDALISDYSSISFSYLLLNRPIGFVLSDLKDYKLGVCVDNLDDYLVGHRIYSLEDMMSFIDDVFLENDKYMNYRRELAEKLYTYIDGNSCERIVDFMESL